MQDWKDKPRESSEWFRLAIRGVYDESKYGK